MNTRRSSSIAKRYGSRRGMVRWFMYRFAYLLGGFRKYRHIDFREVKRLVFICHGNICRSPMGEVYARARGYNAISYGLFCQPDKLADRRAKAFAEEKGLSLTAHRTRPICDYQALAGDLVIAMEPSHIGWLESESHLLVQVTLAALWQKPACPYLHDPYSSPDTYFWHCESQLLRAINYMIGELGEVSAAKLPAKAVEKAATVKSTVTSPRQTSIENAAANLEEN